MSPFQLETFYDSTLYPKIFLILVLIIVFNVDLYKQTRNGKIKEKKNKKEREKNPKNQQNRSKSLVAILFTIVL